MNGDAQALGCAVLNDDAGAVRPSMAMMGMRAIKLQRELSQPVFVAVVNYRRPLIASRVSCASARKLFFSSAREGVGLGKGARACGKSCHFECLEKKQVAKK